jgi:hypothetical protein
MTVRADGDTDTGTGHGTPHHGQGPEDCSPSEFKKRVEELGLRGTYAYVPTKSANAEASPATKAKRTYRAAQKAKNIGQYVVEVPEDEDAKNSVYAVAKAIRDDKDNTANIRSIVLSVVSSPTMLELVKLLSASEADALSVIALIERGDLDKATAIHAALPTLLGDIAVSVDVNAQLVSVLDCLVKHSAEIKGGSAKGLLEAAVAACSSPEILRFIEVRQRGGLRARLLGWALGGTH